MKTQTHLRIPRRALEQWGRVRAALIAQIKARGLVADGPTIFLEAAAMLEAALGAGPGVVAELEPKRRPAWLEQLAPQSNDPARIRENKIDLVEQLRLMADRVEKELHDDMEIETPSPGETETG